MLQKRFVYKSVCRDIALALMLMGKREGGGGGLGGFYSCEWSLNRVNIARTGMGSHIRWCVMLEST